MSALHHAAFAHDRGWSAQEFAALSQSPHVQTFVRDHGFALTRTVAGESELLTLAVDPVHHRQGIARALMRSWLAEVAHDAETAFLEVAADNHAARALYAAFGFVQTGNRPAYYTRTGAPNVDAMVLSCDLTLGQRRESTTQAPESG